MKHLEFWISKRFLVSAWNSNNSLQGLNKLKTKQSRSCVRNNVNLKGWFVLICVNGHVNNQSYTRTY